MKYIWTIICIALLSSCSMQRSVTERLDHRIDYDRYSTLSIDSLVSTMSASSFVRWDSAWHNAVLSFRIFDTSRTDSMGISPVLADGELVWNGGSTSQKQSKDSISQLVEMILNNEESENNNEVIFIDKESKSKFGNYPAWFWAGFVAAAILLGLMIMELNRNNIKL